MRRTAIAGVLALLATGCLSGGAAYRTVLVDYRNDEFASAYEEQLKRLKAQGRKQ